MLGQASVLHSTEQLIDSAHGGWLDSSSVNQNTAEDEDATSSDMLEVGVSTLAPR